MRHDPLFDTPPPPPTDPPVDRWRQVMERAGRFRSVSGLEDGASQSGNEPNDLFVSVGGGARFARLSGLSGFDHRGDGRSLASIDLDRDGRVDLVAVNANAPLLQLFRNEIGGEGGHGFLAIDLVGGSRSDQPDPAWSPRQPIGAIVTVEVGERRLVRELRAGEGLAAQSSDTLLVGLGSATEADRVHVRWPSGRESSVGVTAAGARLRIEERPDGARQSEADP